MRARSTNGGELNSRDLAKKKVRNQKGGEVFGPRPTGRKFWGLAKIYKVYLTLYYYLRSSK
ncbi:hypothetical protein TWF225_006134 [Orbilia oligospora]|nr:hypothetical protein TWF225_006134 [Orbilia oligospora]